MFLVDKKIIYFFMYENETKIAAAGFVKFQHESKGCLLEIHMKGLEAWADGDYTLLLITTKMKVPWDRIKIHKGTVDERKYFSFQKPVITEEGRQLKPDEICGLEVKLDERHLIAGMWKTDLKAASENVLENKGSSIEYNRMQEVGDAGKYGDRWEQLCRYYRQVHPFGDSHVFVAIEPKDLAVLGNGYGKLMNNSFLLHGFYNYRHLILGPDRNQPLEGVPRFCLGVPGTYFEREKMVAIMFGFESFECEGPVEVGKNGYYMRAVSLR